jgi:hypothetical protein
LLPAFWHPSTHGKQVILAQSHGSVNPAYLVLLLLPLLQVSTSAALLSVLLMMMRL